MKLSEILGDSFKEGMTTEEIAKALEGVNLVDPSKLPESVSKATFDKVSSELAAAKKQLKEKMTDAEQKTAEQKAAAEEYEKLKKENSILRYKESFLANGYDAESAIKLAEAFASGDMEEFSKVSKAFMESRKKEIEDATKAELLKKTPTIHSGGGKGDDKSENSIGKQLGKQREETAKKAQSILKNYGIGGN